MLIQVIFRCLLLLLLRNGCLVLGPAMGLVEVAEVPGGLRLSDVQSQVLWRQTRWLGSFCGVLGQGLISSWVEWRSQQVLRIFPQPLLGFLILNVDLLAEDVLFSKLQSFLFKNPQFLGILKWKFAVFVAEFFGDWRPSWCRHHYADTWSSMGLEAGWLVIMQERDVSLTPNRIEGNDLWLQHPRNIWLIQLPLFINAARKDKWGVMQFLLQISRKKRSIGVSWPVSFRYAIAVNITYRHRVPLMLKEAVQFHFRNDDLFWILSFIRDFF
jgi:hypothetical protein